MEQQYPDPVVRQIVSEVGVLIRAAAEGLHGPWLRPDEAAQYLRISKEKLQVLRQTGDGPRFSKPSPQVVLYYRDDLDAWARSTHH